MVLPALADRTPTRLPHQQPAPKPAKLFLTQDMMGATNRHPATPLCAQFPRCGPPIAEIDNAAEGDCQKRVEVRYARVRTTTSPRDTCQILRSSRCSLTAKYRTANGEGANQRLRGGSSGRTTTTHFKYSESTTMSAPELAILAATTQYSTLNTHTRSVHRIRLGSECQSVVLVFAVSNRKVGQGS